MRFSTPTTSPVEFHKRIQPGSPTISTATTARHAIHLEGVRVHNLKNVSLDVPLHKLVVVSGVSGSGKSSLAFDTLYAEGQRRYIESFSAYARQFLDRLERPDADRIDNIPPAIAIRQGAVNVSSKATVATTTEIYDYLRLLFAKIGRIYCPDCRREVRRDTPETILEFIRALPDGARFQIAFPIALPGPDDQTADEILAQLQSEGFNRLIVAGRTVAPQEATNLWTTGTDLYAVVDRLTAGKSLDDRILDSLELAFRQGDGQCVLLASSNRPITESFAITVDDQAWHLDRFNSRLVCDECNREFLEPEPRLFSFNNPLGACPACHGFGSVPAISFDRVVPDPSKTLREGAIAPWTTPKYRHELDELLALAADYGIPVDIPFAELQPEHLALIRDGLPERRFGGLRGFFRWLERHRYEMPVRVFLSRWRAYETCPDCHGNRLQPVALAVRIGGQESGVRGQESGGQKPPGGNPAEPTATGATGGLPTSPERGTDADSLTPALNIAELCRLTCTEAAHFLDEVAGNLTPTEAAITKTIFHELRTRLQYLAEVGLDYVTLDRRTRTLSGGEAQRVALTGTLGSTLVNTLYVLDEPSAGLHPRDSQRVITAIKRLRDARNTVVVVEHEEAFIRQAEHVIDVGPSAGREGGEIVFQGPPADLLAGKNENSVTAAFLSGRRSIPVPDRRRQPSGWLKLTGARRHNLQNITVEFPLGVLCVVTGVSGSGKSTLVGETLHPALCRALKSTGRNRREGEAPAEPHSASPRRKREGEAPAEPHSASIAPARQEPPRPPDNFAESAALFDTLEGTDQLDEVIPADQSPVGRTPRSNPVTYLKAFDEIRRIFAATQEAKLRNLTPTAFSFNAAGGGRCPKCQGSGVVEIEMQFLADISMTCPECHGTRYRPEILDVKYRNLTIADVLAMTVREAFLFFRTHRRLQRQLRFLKDVGLDYLPLGQPATTLSGGESQRLRLASFLASGTTSRTLFLIDEPTLGLHTADVEQLLACFESLLAVGHSLIVVDHDLHLIKAADWIIDLGPEAATAGGRVVATGTPEDIARAEGSITGQWLSEVLLGTHC